MKEKLCALISVILCFCLLGSSCSIDDENNAANASQKEESYYDWFSEKELSEASDITLFAGPSGTSVMWGTKCKDRDIYFKERIVGIQGGAFKGTTLRSVYLPDSIRWIEAEAFCNCISLKYIIIPKELETIGKDAFKGCTRLTDVYFTGDEWDFRMINIGEGNESLTEATIHFNYICPEIKEIRK